MNLIVTNLKVGDKLIFEQNGKKRYLIFIRLDGKNIWLYDEKEEIRVINADAKGLRLPTFWERLTGDFSI